MIKLNYYDNVDAFIESAKRHGLKCQVNGDSIIVSTQGAEVTLKAVPKTHSNRSFSIAFFGGKGLELNVPETCDERLFSTLNDICLEYTDLEMNSIYRDMPLLWELGEKNKGKMKNVAIVWRDHFLEENIGLLNSFVRMGVDPKDILAIDKGDSTLHQANIRNTFKKMGFEVNILDNSLIPDIDKHLDKTKFVFDFIEKRGDKKIILMDDGALVTKIVTKKYPNIVAVLELTEMGLRRIRPMEGELLYPVLNIAKTTLKRKITYPEISNSIFLRILELIGAEKLVGRNVLVLGYGDLGEVLADRMRSFGMNVNIYDPDIMKLIIAGEKGFNTYRNNVEAVKKCKPILVAGASGYNSISEEMVKNLPDYAFVTAGATADLSFFKQFENDPEVCHKVDNLGSQYKLFGKEITILGNGRSVNLFMSEAIPNRANDVFKSGIALSACNAICRQDELKTALELNLVEHWIEESGLLERYYELYIEGERK